MGLLSKVLLFPVTGPVAGIKWSLGQVQKVVEEELTDDEPVKRDLMELQMQLELGDIDDDEYVRREAELMMRLREVRAWRERLGKSTSGGPGARRARCRRGVSALDALLDSLPRTALIVGKGGVGKTTCAAGIAALFARRGERTLLMSTDPAAALAEVIGAPVSTDAAAVEGEPLLDARQLSASRPSSRVSRAAGATRSPKSSIEARISTGKTSTASSTRRFPVSTRSSRCSRWPTSSPTTPVAYARIVVDTAPTGHTLRLLAMPETFRALLSMLDLMQDKHRFMVRALTHRYRRDRADDFLDEMRARIDGLRSALADGGSVAAIVVTRDEPVVDAETRRYVESLEALRMRVAAVIVVGDAGRGTGDGGADAPTYSIPIVPIPPRGLREVVATVRKATPSSTARHPEERSDEGSLSIQGS